MDFNNANEIDNIVWDLRLADWDRGRDRALINDLFDGFPPFDEDYAEQFPNNVNVNDLSATKIDHDARRQFYNAFCVPDPLFTVELDYGPIYRRAQWANKITSEIAKSIRNSPAYLELRENVFAGVVLHGIGPGMWEDRERWCPVSLGIEDVFVPGNTLRSLENLPFFCIYRKYSGEMLKRLTRGPRVDKAWNMPLVNQCLEWLDEEAMKLNAQNFPEVWSEEKRQARVKESSGVYYADVAPTVDCIDFYFYDDTKKTSGWRRRIILDTFGVPGSAGGMGTKPTSPVEKVKGSKGQFLYNPHDRKYGDSLGEIIHFQFGDASAVPPFRYHSVRSLGFLLYSVCQLQNRLRCKFSDAVFESLLQYFRVNNPSDQERLSKVELVDKGIIPAGLEFIPNAQRWQVNEGLAGALLQMNRQSMSDVSVSFTQDFDFDAEQRTSRETATRTNAKMTNSAALVAGMLNRAYNYERFRYQEICRRFCIKNSKDADVRSFRVECLKDGVPEEALDVNRWTIKPVKIIGSGNKAMQVGIMDKIMAQYYQLLDPAAQQRVKRMGLAVTLDDYELANQLVPEQKEVSEAAHDAQMSFGTMMQGVVMALKQGVNHQEYVEALLGAMASIIQDIEGSGGMATPQQIKGLQIVAGQTIQGQPIPGNGITSHIQILAQDKQMVAKVNEYSDDLGRLMNLVKAFAQRLAEQAQKGNGQQQPGLDPKALVKAQEMKLMGEEKRRQMRQSHSERTAQRQVQFQVGLQQDMAKHQAELAKMDLEAASSINRNRLTSLQE